MRWEDVHEAATHRHVAALRHEVGPEIPLREERRKKARRRKLVSPGDAHPPPGELLGEREDPEERARRDDEDVRLGEEETGERAELLAAHFERRRDSLIRRQRRRRKVRHARGAEDRLGVAPEGERVALVREDGGDAEAEGYGRGVEKVRQEPRRSPDERHDALPRPEDPLLEPRREARHRLRGGDRVDERVSPAAARRDYDGGGRLPPAWASR